MKKKDKAEPKGLLPLSDAPLPLLTLPPDALGKFLELCFVDKELLKLCGELKLYSPGYRLENMPPPDVARMLADEARAAKDALQLVEKAVRNMIRAPLFEGQALTDLHYRDALESFFGDRLLHVARIAWRALLEEDEKKRDHALSAIDVGIELLSLPPPSTGPKPDDLPENVKAARAEIKELRRSTGEAVNKMARAEKERAAIKEQLAAARAETAEREKALAEAREELSRERAEHAKASG